MPSDLGTYPEDYTEDDLAADNGYVVCTDSRGHEYHRTGTAYGGDDPRWSGEGRSLCIYCGADGDA